MAKNPRKATKRAKPSMKTDEVTIKDSIRAIGGYQRHSSLYPLDISITPPTIYNIIICVHRKNGVVVRLWPAGARWQAEDLPRDHRGGKPHQEVNATTSRALDQLIDSPPKAY